MKEKVCRFGEKGKLLGVITEPDGCKSNEHTPAVILLNAGLVHRVGPFRLNVEMARTVASAGFMAFRFDLSGLGDSEPVRDTRSREERAVTEIQAAMYYLSDVEGIGQFVLIGLCTGADQAHRTAVADTRVTGAVFLDGYGYKTWRFYVNHYGPRLLRLTAWTNFVKRHSWERWRTTGEKSSETETIAEVYAWRLPPKPQSCADLSRFVKRGVNLLYVYSGGVASYYNYRRQLEDSFKEIDFAGKLQVDYFPLADHLYMLVEDRRSLITTIREWLQVRYRPDLENAIQPSDHTEIKVPKLEHKLASAK